MCSEERDQQDERMLPKILEESQEELDFEKEIDWKMFQRV
jgi:hypothetical protein